MPGLPMPMDPNQHYIKDEDVDDTFGDDEQYDATDSATAIYKPRPQLPKPFVFMRCLADIIKDLDNGLIDVDPEYQREVVWTADRMTGLVNSLMENFYIPPIILNKKTSTAPADKPKEAVHVCVDGKQRLSSVRAFVKGMIPVHDYRGEKWWFCNTTRGRKRILSEDAQKAFLTKEFVSFEFKDLSPEQEEDLFARVQMGVQLSIAEKMRASTGPWQELARLFVEDFDLVYSLMKDRARAKDFQLTLSCFSQIVEVMHPTAADGVPTLKTNHNALPKLLSNKSAVDDGLKSHLASVWTTFKDLIELDSDTFTNANKYLRGVQTFAPVEMVGVAVLISVYSETRNKQLLLGDIRALREAIRENFVDIRTNASVWKFIWDFIDSLEAIRGATNNSTIDRTAQPLSTYAASVAPPSIPASPSGSGAKGKSKAPAKTKPPKVLPSQQPFVIKKEEEKSSAHSSETRKPKRQRTDPGSPSLPAATVGYTGGIFDSTLLPPHPIATNPNGYRAPAAHMISAVSVPSKRPSISAQTPPNHTPLLTSPASASVNSRDQSTTLSKAGTGICSSKPSEQRRTAEAQAMTPQHATLSETTAPRRRSLQKPCKVPQQSMPAQYDGAIDLTSDTEQERQDLLSAFKASALATKWKNNTPDVVLSGAPQPSTSIRHHTKRMPVRANPYERVKQGADTSMFGCSA